MNKSVELSHSSHSAQIFTGSETCSLDNQNIFKQWMTEHEKLLRHIINGFEAKPAIQDELYQEIALNIWRALPSFRKEAKVKTFVARIAHNVLATHVAKSVKSVKAEQDVTDENIEHQHSHYQASPYQELDQQQRQQRLISAIRQLKLEQQQVMTLALEGMSYQDISDALAISTSLVGVRLNRAKSALMSLLEA